VAGWDIGGSFLLQTAGPKSVVQAMTSDHSFPRNA